jgi:DNA repair protein RadC
MVKAKQKVSKKIAAMKIETSNNLAEVTASYNYKVKVADMKKISSSTDCFEVLKSVWTNDIEYIEEFVVLFLNRANKVLGWKKIGVGGVSGVVADPKIIFQLALLANASAIIISHNHPSGNLRPSDADNALTKKLKEGGNLLEIPVLDHLIITPDEYFSYADEGRM